MVVVGYPLSSSLRNVTSILDNRINITGGSGRSRLFWRWLDLSHAILFHFLCPLAFLINLLQLLLCDQMMFMVGRFKEFLNTLCGFLPGKSFWVMDLATEAMVILFLVDAITL